MASGTTTASRARSFPLSDRETDLPYMYLVFPLDRAALRSDTGSVRSCKKWRKGACMASPDKDISLVDVAVNVLGACCLVAAAVIWPLGFILLVLTYR